MASNAADTSKNSFLKTQLFHPEKKYVTKMQVNEEKRQVPMPSSGLGSGQK